MDNYKILNSDANQIVKLLNELGYTWNPNPSTNDSETSLLKAYWIITESSGELVYSSTESFVDEDLYKEISLAQLNDLVAQSKNEQGLISGADALAMVHTCTVQYSCSNDPVADRWTTITDHFWDQYNLGVFLNQDTTWKFRLKPRTITLNVEIPAPFEPKNGDLVFVLDNAAKEGFTSFNFDGDFYSINFGAWRTEEEIKQVVAALRGIKG